jgi:mannan polymerase II complex MNN10 subunit
MWHKFNMLEAAIETNKYDWIWWIDFDTLITNTTVELADIVLESLANETLARQEKIDFLFTADWYALPLLHSSQIISFYIT